MRYCNFILILAWVLLRLKNVYSQQKPLTPEEQKAYLRQFGYLDTPMAEKLANITDERDPLKSAIKGFQRMAGIDMTGTMDNETMTKMMMPRCGEKDMMGMGNVARRRKRFAAQGSKWTKNVVNYQFVGPLTKDLDPKIIKSEVQKAFDIWSSAVPELKFKEGSPVDIEVKFVTRDHGDGNAFDGPGKVLAHAFFPQYGGDIHFDDDETFTSETKSGTNLLQVAIHELGHSMGLEHSDVKEAIMYPFYRGYVPNVKLHSDDIAGMKYIYQGMTRPVQSDWCVDSSFDAVFSIDSSLFAFKGSEFGIIDMNGVIAGYPKNISLVWAGLPSDIDAAMVWSQEGTTDPPGFIPLSVYFFKGENCYHFTFIKGQGFVLTPGYPRNISMDFPGIPGNLDAAFVWSGNGKPYFFKGDKYYRFTRGSMVDAGFPRSSAAWKGLPKKIDSAFSNRGNSRTYFFSGNDFYRFNDIDFKVDPGYPRKTAEVWLGCQIDGMGGNQMMKEMLEGRMQFQGAGGQQLLSSGVMASILTGCAIYLLNVREIGY